MGSKETTPKSTRKKAEPHTADVPNSPMFSAVLIEMAWQVAIPFMVLALGGSWLDGRLDSEPVFTIVGTFLGLVAVGLVVYRLINRHYPDTFNKGGK